MMATSEDSHWSASPSSVRFAAQSGAKKQSAFTVAAIQSPRRLPASKAMLRMSKPFRAVRPVPE